MNRFLFGLGVSLCVTAVGVAIGSGSAADERLEVAGNVKLLGVGNGVIFPDGTKLTTAGGGSGTIFTDALNTAVGVSALSANTSGETNTAVGAEALHDNTTGASNTAVGYQALPRNTTATNNSAFGHQALAQNTTGLANTAVGYGAAFENTTGSSNTAIGSRALSSNQTGYRNIAVGFEAGFNTTGNYNIHIGNAGGATESRTIRIGIAGGGFHQTVAFIAGIRGKTTGSANTVPVLIDLNGQLGTASSSRRYKEDIRDIADASGRLMALRPVTFRYTQPYADGSKPLDYGLIAEEVAEVYPDLVVSGADGQVETVQYHKLTPLLLNEVQRQHRRVVELEAQNATLLKRLAALEAKVGAARQE